MTMHMNVGSPFQGIVESIYLLELAFRLQIGFKKDLINKACFTNGVFISTGTGTFISEREFDDSVLNARFHNLILLSIEALAIAIDRGLDDVLRKKNPERNDSINSLRAFFYQLRCACAHDVVNPKWLVKEKYMNRLYEVIVPAEIVRTASKDKSVGEKKFTFDFKGINGEFVQLGHFGGVDGLILLSLYAASLVENDKPTV